jgi:catechol 2,3-dioxygenase
MRTKGNPTTAQSLGALLKSARDIMRKDKGPSTTLSAECGARNNRASKRDMKSKAKSPVNNAPAKTTAQSLGSILKSPLSSIAPSKESCEMSNPSIDPGVRIGHVHLKVADLERALKFYCGVLGFELQQRYGAQAAFVSAGGYHHHIGLNTWESKGGSSPPPGTTGLFHLAILYPTRAMLADALRRVLAAGIHLDGASDHGVSEALYLRDPDDNGVELYWDRPESEWPRSANSELAMFTRPLDVDRLLKEGNLA